MPLYNHSNDPMPLLPEKEREENQKYAGIYWERDRDYVLHMTPTDLKKWLYNLNPRDSLILMSTHGISTQLKKQLSWKRFSIITDWFWRIMH